jgi:hypothetical protein
MIIAYELSYSPHVMFMLLMMLCFDVHIMFMDRNRLVLGWWFIMPSGMSKSFTYRSVGSGPRGIWVVSIYASEVSRYIVAGDCMPNPRSRGRWAGGDSPVHPLYSPTFG